MNKLLSDLQVFIENICLKKKIVDVFALVTSSEIRKLRLEQPENLATLCYKVCIGS